MITLSDEHRQDVIKSCGHCQDTSLLDLLQKECSDELLRTLLSELIDSALRYVESVCKFKAIVKDPEKNNFNSGFREDIENARGSIHDVFIDNARILERAMRQKYIGKNLSWTRTLNLNNRATYAAFALKLAFDFIIRSTTLKEDGQS